MPAIRSLEAGGEVIEYIDASGLDGAQVLSLGVIQQIRSELLTVDVGLLGVGDQLLDGTVEVGLLETAA